ncbi:uncharacterized protein BDR25DRAFT_350258 [Lindgomyces ingoldianus]|uniref:Uncharacterized protein n=1 Tax=Lindgomyces ingoldianus TaxID=673940 RepID=A0ACB6R9N6_9PLEO|nr:uncharacterized protein BDR25DRAFT_350258 [Lindgomyces ingoldianus]KAF2475979.1 hypothetical protein BDR25DRAFT_350258 [Lindgomyces ingoldianus]
MGMQAAWLVNIPSYREPAVVFGNRHLVWRIASVGCSAILIGKTSWRQRGGVGERRWDDVTFNPGKEREWLNRSSEWEGKKVHERKGEANPGRRRGSATRLKRKPIHWSSHCWHTPKVKLERDVISHLRRGNFVKPEQKFNDEKGLKAPSFRRNCLADTTDMAAYHRNHKKGPPKLNARSLEGERRKSRARAIKYQVNETGGKRSERMKLAKMSVHELQNGFRESGRDPRDLRDDLPIIIVDTFFIRWEWP